MLPLVHVVIEKKIDLPFKLLSCVAWCFYDQLHINYTSNANCLGFNASVTQFTSMVEDPVQLLNMFKNSAVNLCLIDLPGMTTESV